MRYRRVRDFGILMTFTGILLLFFSIQGWATPWKIAVITLLLGIGVLGYAYLFLKARAFDDEIDE
ncbi:hypothetical protein [Arcanobacterium bovis]|uniref:Uncharacterized protein n=1 Tax=Arcanobacterium bovis TaxID=2529275 RepID=A0A4Q9V1U5_9ACTO|nr:hypothetical protein [Arcanobacterium bovis]TBW22090.1 hypothetical protein EZJ44_04490 [Arcanobacterium bovis]